MKRILLLTLFLFFTHSAAAQLLSWRDIMDQESSRPDTLIHYGTDSLQYGELWLPDKKPSHTTVIMIHGGCWLSQYPGTKLMHLVADDLRQHGFAVWNLEYRRLGHNGGGYPGTFQDIANGADYLMEIAEDFGLNMERIIATGHSAGGHLAVWLAGRKNISPESTLFAKHPVQVNAVISLAGINDLKRYADYGSSPCGEKTVEKLVDLESRGDDAYSDTSPAELLPFGIPVFEISAAFDAPVPPFFGYHFTRKASGAGDQASHLLLPDAGHFEMIHNNTREWRVIRGLFYSVPD